MVAVLLAGCGEPHGSCAVRGCQVMSLWIYNGFGTDDYNATLTCGRSFYLGNNADGRPADIFNGYEVGDVWNTPQGPREDR